MLLESQRQGVMMSKMAVKHMTVSKYISESYGVPDASTCFEILSPQPVTCRRRLYRLGEQQWKQVYDVVHVKRQMSMLMGARNTNCVCRATTKLANESFTACLHTKNITVTRKAHARRIVWIQPWTQRASACVTHLIYSVLSSIQVHLPLPLAWTCYNMVNAKTWCQT